MNRAVRINNNIIYRFENCGARRAALRPYFNRLSDDFP